MSYIEDLKSRFLEQMNRDNWRKQNKIITEEDMSFPETRLLTLIGFCTLHETGMNYSYYKLVQKSR